MYCALSVLFKDIQWWLVNPKATSKEQGKENDFEVLKKSYHLSVWLFFTTFHNFPSTYICLKFRFVFYRHLPKKIPRDESGCSRCTNPQIFGTSPFAPADFEASSTMCTCCFEIQSSPGCSCTRRSKVLTHSLKFPHIPQICYCTSTNTATYFLQDWGILLGTWRKYVNVLVRVLQLLKDWGILLRKWHKFAPLPHTLCTPPRTPRISGLKSQILKPTFLS